MKFNYEGNSLKSGIYKIINTINNRIYIGSAKEFKARWQNGHRNSLVRNKHSNQFLQADYNKCKSNFNHDDFLEFYIVQLMENSTKEERKKVEQEWIDKYFDNGNQCYNLQKKALISKANLPSSHRGKKHSLEWNQRIGESHKGKKLSEEHKIKIGLSSKGRGLGTKRDPSIGQKISKSKIGKSNPMSEETKLKLSKIYNVKLISPDGIIYEKIVGLTVFAKVHALSRAGLKFLITGQRASHKGWKLFF